MHPLEPAPGSGASGIVWLASYPKSGNTWLRALLTSCLTDGLTPNLDDLVGRPIAFQRDLLDDHAGISSAEYSLDELVPFQASLHRDLVRQGGTPLFIKTHSAFITSADGNPLFAREASAAVIYLVRDPFDLVFSLADHLGCQLDQAIDAMGEPGWVMDCWRDRSSSNLAQRVGNWSENVTSWIGQTEIPLLAVRYEDLLAEPAAHLARICSFVGVAVEADRIANAVESCRFAKLRGQEDRFGFAEKPRSAMRFFRSGRAGEGARDLTMSQRKTIWLAHGCAMQRMGYAIPGDV